MREADISKFKHLPTIGFQPFGDVVIHFREHPRWKIPRKIAVILDETARSDQEIIEQTVTLARALGREPMTGPEYGKSLGMKPF
jgi:hypothetical protein